MKTVKYSRVIWIILVIVSVSFFLSNLNVHCVTKKDTIKRNLSKSMDIPVKDYGANPVFSGWSEIGGFHRDKSLPEIIPVDYKPITINSSMNNNEVESALVALTLQRQIICTNWEMYGINTDGGWPVCKAKPLLPQKPCTVYSFGINFDFSFDDAYHDKHGCTIRSFDPSMNVTEHEHSPSVFFYPIGLSDSNKTLDKGWEANTYAGFLRRFNEENDIIPYLKFDIETMEWRVLEEMFSGKALNNVMQLSFEIHLNDARIFRGIFNLVKQLEQLGFRRWFYRHRLNGNPYQCDQSYINTKFLQRKVL